MVKLSKAEIDDQLKKIGVQSESDRCSYLKEYKKYRKLNGNELSKKAEIGKTRKH